MSFSTFRHGTYAFMITLFVISAASCNFIPEKPGSATEQAEFFGGKESMNAWIGANVNYPQEAMEEGIEGRVMVRFVVDKNGHVKNAVVAKFAHPLLDREALRVIETMPDWKPGTVRGKPVQTLFNLPITFKLQ